MEKIKNETLADLDELLDFTYELFDLYHALIELDFNNQKNSLEYTRYVTRIKEIKNLTITIEDRIASDYDELKKVIKLLDQKLGLNYDPNEIDIIMCFGLDKNLMVPIRILNNLNQRYSEKIKVEEILSNDGIDYDEDDLAQTTKHSKYRRCFGSLFSTNIDLMVLAKIKKEGLFSDNNLGKHFHRIKYEMAFLNSDVEKELLNSNFEVDEKPYIVKNGINNMFGVSYEYDEDFKSEIFYSILCSHLEKLKKNDYEIAKNRLLAAEAITHSYSILVATVLLDNDEKAYTVLKELESLSNKISKYHTFVILKNLLDIIIDDYEKEKKEYQFISFGGRK